MLKGEKKTRGGESGGCYWKVIFFVCAFLYGKFLMQLCVYESDFFPLISLF